MEKQEIQEIFKSGKNLLFTLEDIFDKNRYFRIPNYQRGYAWASSEHVEVFWQDFQRIIRSENMHYMGMLSLEKGDDESLGYENLKSKELFYIIDGQQRLTTCLVFLIALKERLQELNTSESNKLAKEIEEKYISSNKLYRFLYSKKRSDEDNEFLTNKIFSKSTNKAESGQSNYYMHRLLQSKSFFCEQIKDYQIEKCKIAHDALTQKLIFNILFSNCEANSKGFDVRVLFETINNRGKELSNLEKLKNRLIYISSYLYIGNEDRQILINELIEKITLTWHEIYTKLGLINYEDNTNIDDNFLVAHWLMFSKGSVKISGKSPELDEIFNKVFIMDYDNNIKNVEEFCGQFADNTLEQAIETYVESIELAVEFWVLMHNPSNVSVKSLDSRINLKTIDSLSRLIGEDKHIKAFILYLLINAGNKLSVELVNTALTLLEKYLFITKYIILKNINYAPIATFINDIEKGQGSKDDKLRNSLRVLIEGKYLDGQEKKSKDNKSNNSLKELLSAENVKAWINAKATSFYGSWREGLKYVLYEMNNDIKGGDPTQRKPIVWSDFKKTNSLEHVFPQTPSKKNGEENAKYWEAALGNAKLDDNGKLMMTHTLGNMLPLSQKVNSTIGNYMYPIKRVKNSTSGDFAYSNDSAMANEFSNDYEHWDINKIISRTYKMLEKISTKWLQIDENIGDCKNAEIKYDLLTHFNMFINFNYKNALDLSEKNKINAIENGKLKDLYKVNESTLSYIRNSYFKKLQKIEEEKANKKKGPRTPTISFDEFVAGKSKKQVELLRELVEKVLEELQPSKLHIKNDYLSIKKEKHSFIDMRFRKSDIKITTRDPNSKGWCNTYYTTNDKLDDLMEIIRKSYQQGK